jgi:hypothetical protein
MEGSDMKRESNTIPKKKWARPKLIVLTRGDRQEGVLAGCKNWAMHGAADLDNRCSMSGWCEICFIISAS